MSSTTSSVSPTLTTSVAAATSSSATKTLQAPKNLKVVGIILAVVSGILIGSSFVFKKKGLLRSQQGQVAGEGVAYLKSALWWTGMIMMILGEICNFAAYAFVEAIVVTPLGALSVVVCAILSSLFLNETLSFFGWLGCGLCILGSVIIALNGPKESTIGQIREFQKLFLAPGFLAYTSVVIVASLVLIFYFAPKYGKKSMLWYIFICSMIGGISVSVTTGLGAAIVQTAMGDNQFKYWFMYFLAAFVIITLLTEVYYLNVALALFNTAMGMMSVAALILMLTVSTVTPTYYVIFTFFSLVTTVVLYQGLHASAAQIITIVMAFLVICLGITILQMSKVDPAQLSKLDRKSTLLLQAARQKTETMEEKGAVGVEDPGMDALRGSFGTVGSIIRARSARKLSQSSGRPSFLARPASGIGSSTAYDIESSPQPYFDHEAAARDGVAGLTRHQLYDAPVPRLDSSALSPPSSPSAIGKRPTIKFDTQDMVHQYSRPGTGDNSAIHQHRDVVHSPLGNAYPPSPQPRGVTPETISTTSGSSSTNPDSASSDVFGKYDDDESDAVTLPLLPRLSSEHAVHSAPPLVSPRIPKRIDARDIFGAHASRAPTQLPTFPSLDSNLGAEDDRLSPRSGSSGGKSDRARSPKRPYPKGDHDDDQEESVSLWHRNDAADEPPPPGVGIRLVKPTSGPSSKF